MALEQLYFGIFACASHWNTQISIKYYSDSHQANFFKPKKLHIR